MKKNVMMRVASALLVAVLMTTCAISGTFAKYTTSDTDTDSARVAKWGVNVDVVGAGAFNTNYDNGELEVSSTEKVVAPGTNGTLTTVTISGQPEVMVEVLVDFELELEGWEINTPSEEYCPLTFKVGETTITKTGTIDEFETAVETAVENALKKASVAVGTPLNATLNVTWEWAFTTSAANDVKDTELAKLADAGNAPEISFNCTVIVNQLGD